MLQALVGHGGKPLSVQELAEKTKADPLLTSKSPWSVEENKL